MENLENIEQVKNAMLIFNLWGKDGRDQELLFSGTIEECERELEENYDPAHPDYEICKNEIADRWENEVEGIGYVKMHNGEVIDFNL